MSGRRRQAIFAIVLGVLPALALVTLTALLGGGGASPQVSHRPEAHYDAPPPGSDVEAPFEGDASQG